MITLVTSGLILSASVIYTLFDLWSSKKVYSKRSEKVAQMLINPSLSVLQSE